MARDQGYLVSYIAKLTEYCDVLLLQGCYFIGIDKLIKSINKGKVRYINLSSPLVNAIVKDDPEKFVNELSCEEINVISDIQYTPEIIPYIRSRYEKNLKSRYPEKLSLIISTSARIDGLSSLTEIIAEKMFKTTLYTNSVAEVMNYPCNILDKLYQQNIQNAVYGTYKIHEIMGKASFTPLQTNAIEKKAFFDLLMNTILTQNFSFLYQLNSPSKATKIMVNLANKIGQEIDHRVICQEIRLDDITYPAYYHAILDSFLGFEISPLPENLYKKTSLEENEELENNLIETEQYISKSSELFEKKSKFFFMDANILAYLQGIVIDKTTYGDFIKFNQIFSNFIIAELAKITSSNAGVKLYYLNDGEFNFDIILTREGSKAIVFKIRSTDTCYESDIEKFDKLIERMGENFYRGYIIYLGRELHRLTDNIYALPVNYLWSDFEYLCKEEQLVDENEIPNEDNAEIDDQLFDQQEF